MANTMNEEELRERTRALLSEVHPDKVDRVTFRGTQFDQGLAWVHFPEGHGGLGLTPNLQAVVNDEIRKNAKTFYNDLELNPIGIGMGGPVVLTYASDELKKRLLRPMFTAEEIWCQLFSEPSAGSDVAGLSSRAVRDGDEWVVNGQKVWTTLAHISKWGMLVTRTNPDVPKHKGLSYFLLDMQADGVDVRPLYQITGEAEFNEIFMTDVRIPHDRMLGEEGAGWQVAITTLMNERTALGGGSGHRKAGPVATLQKVWNQRDKSALSGTSEAVLRDRITKLHIESELLRITGIRARSSQLAGGNPGPEGSVGKLAQSEIYKQAWECSLDVIGQGSLLYEAGYDLKRPEEAPRDDVQLAKYQFLRSRANSIEGGTSEVMRNILGERVLGLPGEPRVDKGIAWKDIPRSAS